MLIEFAAEVSYLSHFVTHAEVMCNHPIHGPVSLFGTSLPRGGMTA